MFAANRFDLLGEDDSGDGAVTRPLPVQPAKKEEKPAAKAPVKAAKPLDAQPARKPATDAKERPKGDRPPYRPRRDEQHGEEPGASGAGNGSPSADRAVRGPPRAPFNGERRERRDRENGAQQAQGNRRVFDRRSGTGRGREEKRGGAGRGNWGTTNDEIAAAPVAAEEKPEGTAEEGAAGEEAGEQTETGAEQPAEPKRELTAEELARQAEREKEERQMTLDEYLKKKQQNAVVIAPLPEPRKAGEGEDNSQWAKFIAAKSDKQAEQPERAGKQQPKTAKAKEADAAAALLRFKSEAVQRREAERRERNARFREGGDRPERPPRPAAKPAAAEAAQFGDADFPVLKA